MREIPNQKTVIYFTKNGHSVKDIQTINRWTPDAVLSALSPFLIGLKKNHWQ